MFNETQMEELQVKKKSNSKMSKFWIIVTILLVLLIPIAFTSSIVDERQDYQKDAVKEITSSWGKEQILHTPTAYFTKDGKSSYLELKNYTADINLNTEIRKRGIFKVPVYTADVNLKGTFINNRGNLSGKNLIYNFNVTDSIGFIQEPVLKLNNGNNITLQSTTYVRFYDALPREIPFEISYKLRGSSSIFVRVKGQQNNVNIQGNWKDPSFKGTFLPENRTVEKDKFNAQWSIPYIAACEIENPEVGLSLLMPVNNYSMTDRTIKYAFLFLALTFLSYFIYEISSEDKNRRVHPLQYLMLGGGMLMFYLLLLSLSEYFAFGIAYIIASLMVIGLSSGYTHFVITKGKNPVFTMMIAALLAMLYIFLYLLLSLQDLALLVGTLGLFIIIAVIMYATRNVDWYSD